MEKQCFIELGSNRHSDRIIRNVREVLQSYFPDITFGKIRRTQPVGSDFPCPAPFFNQSGCFNTPLSEVDVRCILKRIETDHGRKPEDKTYGIVRIDIDLLIYDGRVLKEKDLSRDYIRAGLAELHYPFL